MSPLQMAFAEARAQRSIAPVFEPFVTSKLFVIGILDDAGRPNIALKASPRIGRKCATVSEKREWLQMPDNRTLPIMGDKIIELIHDFDIVVVYDEGGDLLKSEDIAVFREALT